MFLGSLAYNLYKFVELVFFRGGGISADLQRFSVSVLVSGIQDVEYCNIDDRQSLCRILISSMECKLVS